MDNNNSWLHQIRDYLCHTRQIDLMTYKDGYLRRRLQVRQRAVGCPTLQSYYEEHLAGKPQEINALLDSLTINVSRFFRNEGLFRRLHEELVPSLCAKHKALSVWSAGCATGEEAYSLAILLREARGGTAAPDRVIATDIDRASLDFANRGCFPREKVRELPDALQELYFESSGKDCQANADIRHMVEFLEHNLFHEFPWNAFNLVLCRNVVMYFRIAVQEELYQKIAEVVKPGGYLILGRVERLTPSLLTNFQPIDQREQIYQKRSGPARENVTQAQGTEPS